MSKGIRIDGWLDRKATAAYLGLTDYWLEKHCNDMDAPPYVRFGRKAWYRRDDLDTWRNERRANSLEGLHDLGVRRPDAAPPSAQELDAKYAAEHGTTLPVTSLTYKRLRREFVNTLSMQQRQLFQKLESS